MYRSRPQPNSLKNERETENKLNLRRKIGYSIGHVYNDSVAACFLSYIIVFVKISVGLEPKYGGYILFIVQLGDTIVNPILGVFEDKCNCCLIFGKRIIWFIIGMIATTVSFGIMFNVDVGGAGESQLEKLLYYVPFSVFLASGYKFMQLTHLAILTDIASSETDRIQLNSWRNAFTLVSNLFVYCGVWLLLYLRTGDNDVTKLTSNDAGSFKMLSQIIIAVGLTVSFLFCWMIRKDPLPCFRRTKITTADDQSKINDISMISNCTLEKRMRHSAEENHLDTTAIEFSVGDSDTKGLKKGNAVTPRSRTSKECNTNGYNDTNLKINCDYNFSEVLRKTSGTLMQQRRKSILLDPVERNWLRKILKEALFYEIAIVYSCTRFVVMVSLVYIPLYVTDTLEMDKTAIGILPLILYVSGFGTSLLMKRLNKRFGLKKIFIGGEILTLSSCVWIFFIDVTSHEQIYVVSVVFGAGQATLNVTSVALITHLIGRNVDHSASVFGIIGFAEKILQTIFLLIIQIWNPCGEDADESVCSEFYRIIIVGAPSVATVLEMIVHAIHFIRQRISNDTKEEKQSNTNSENAENQFPGNDEECTHF